MNDLTPETWETIPGYNQRYQASNLGRVRSTDLHTTDNMGRPRLFKGRVLTQVALPSGYLTTQLSHRTKARTRLVHRLVAAAFHGEPLPGQQTNHKNGDKADNRPENLEWVTQSQNMRHAVREGLWVAARGERAAKSKLTEADVRAIRRLLPPKKHGDIIAIARQFGVTAQAVTSIASGRTWSHLRE